MALVYSLGSINLDVQMRVDDDVPLHGLVLGRDLEWLPGGKAANVAVAVARLGGGAVLLGAVGADEMGGLALDGPRSAGVDTSQVRRVSAPTGAACILVRPDGDKSIVLAPGANDDRGEDPALASAGLRSAPDGSVLVVDLEVPAEVVSTAVEVARSAGIPVVVDPSPPGRLTDPLAAVTEHVTPDHREARTLTGVEVRSPDAARAAAERLVSRGIGAAHVKLPSGGCVTSWRQGTVAVRAPRVPAVDTTGAGDAFAGGLAEALRGGADAVEAARYGVATSTCAVGSFGSQMSYPTRAELDDVLRDVRVERFD